MLVRKVREIAFVGNLMRKCFGFSSQTVITDDLNLELDEVGMPRPIAITLTNPRMKGEAKKRGQVNGRNRNYTIPNCG